MPIVYANTNDGFVESSQTTWAAARDATVGTSANNVAALVSHGVGIAGLGVDLASYVQVRRSFFEIDTSAITVPPASATFNFYVASNANGDIILVKSNWKTPLAAASIDALPGFSAGNTMAGNVTDYSNSTSLTANTFNSITLNSTALSDMASLSSFKFALVEYGSDYLNVDPGSGGDSRIGVAYNDFPGTTYDAYVDYVEGSAGRQPQAGGTPTRSELRDGYQVTTQLDAATDYEFVLKNNVKSQVYFTIESAEGKQLFESASIRETLNCSFVSESNHMALISSGKGVRGGFTKMSGSIGTNPNEIKPILTGTFSGSRKYLTATSLLSSFTDVSASVSTYNNVSSSNFNLTASITLDTTESISAISNLTGESASLAIGDVIIFPSESLGATTADGRDATFTLTEGTFTYTGVSASNANVTASLYLIESTSLGTVTVTGQGQEFTTGDTIIFPSQSFGATNTDGEDMTFILRSRDLISNGTSSFLVSSSTYDIIGNSFKVTATNPQVHYPTSSIIYGVDLSIET